MAVALAPAQLEGGAEDPFSMFSGWDSGQLLWLAFLVPLAVLVFFVGARRQRAQLGASSIVPRGRDRFVRFGAGRRDAAWRATVERLEQRKPTAIAKAQAGPVRIEAVIQSASGNLGGAPGHECVWRNRAGAGPQTAVAADLLVVSDGTGLCGVEELEGARVTAPTDKVGAHYESVSLRIGDTIEVIGTFEADLTGRHEDPSQLVYGTVGADGRLEIRVLHRPDPPSASPLAEDDLDGQASQASADDSTSDSDSPSPKPEP
ncbi:hypothetical protein [Paraliomyxa miuraensis]|uniref:hypothetical protein n=1 Tax=Paraliomyxa miuraensis TaxID=376150 RepID=UPI00224F7A5D|nr:hypothetical protein [Paraliomyxa miuraensis]MCX4244878.1 hypothetical protein [Paraliomyxa miuraensis]